MCFPTKVALSWFQMLFSFGTVHCLKKKSRQTCLVHFCGLFWLCHWISPKGNKFLQRIFFSKLLPTVCKTPTKFQKESSKTEGKIWMSYRVTVSGVTVNLPIDAHSCTFLGGTSLTVNVMVSYCLFMFVHEAKALKKN